MATSRSILIAGGGIAGLSAALAIAQAGFKVRVFESAKSFETVGSGIQISPNASRVLELLGLSRSINSVAGVPTGIDIRSAYSGDVLNTVPLGEKVREKYGAAYLTLHRADLHQVLLSACQNHQDITLNLDHCVDVCTQHRNGVSIIVSHKNTIDTIAGQFLVVADGVNSKLRNMINPEEKDIAAKHTGYCAWRGMLPAESAPEFLDMDYVHLCLAQNAHAVLYPVNRKRYLNMVFVSPTKDTNMRVSQSADVQVLKDSLLGSSRKNIWTNRFEALLSEKIKWSIWPILEIPKTSHWGTGSILSIGDAAHALAPFSGQGAALAIEDGYELAQLLKRDISDVELQKQFHNLRVPRVNKMRKLVKSNVGMYHMGSALGSVRNTVMKATPPAMLLSKQNWIYNWQPQD